MKPERRFPNMAIAFLATVAYALPALAEQLPSDAQAIVKDWPVTAKKAAMAMIQKYGEPAEATGSMLVWRANGPWVRTVVYAEEIDHAWPMPHKDVLEQFIHYDVPPGSFDELANYDGSVIAERTKGELSARCDKEDANFLALNLADDVIKGEKSVEEARAVYADSIQKMLAGNPPKIMSALEFEPARSDITNKDQTVIKN